MRASLYWRAATEKSHRPGELLAAHAIDFRGELRYLTFQLRKLSFAHFRIELFVGIAPPKISLPFFCFDLPMKFEKNPLELGGWSSSEIAELLRLREAFPLPLYENEDGVSEEGDPWWVITEMSSDRVLVHITRIDQKYSVLSPEEQVLKSTFDPKSAIDLAIAIARARR